MVKVIPWKLSTYIITWSLEENLVQYTSLYFKISHNSLSLSLFTWMKKIVEDEGGETQQSCRVPGQSQTASLRLHSLPLLLHFYIYIKNVQRRKLSSICGKQAQLEWNQKRHNLWSKDIWRWTATAVKLNYNVWLKYEH